MVRSDRPRYIAVEGPIGAGKSSLAEILAEELSARIIRENPEENPFLGPFYKDPRRHAMSVQLFFLLQRYGQQSELSQGDLFARGGVVSDYLFAKDRLFASINLSPDEMALYDRIYQMLKPRTVTPDLVVYLQARTGVLLDRIRKRARPEEKPLRAEYVEEVARAYAEFFFNYNEGPLLIVNASDIDFVGNASPCSICAFRQPARCDVLNKMPSVRDDFWLPPDAITKLRQRLSRLSLILESWRLSQHRVPPFSPMRPILLTPAGRFIPIPLPQPMRKHRRMSHKLSAAPNRREHSIGPSSASCWSFTWAQSQHCSSSVGTCFSSWLSCMSLLSTSESAWATIAC